MSSRGRAIRSVFAKHWVTAVWKSRFGLCSPSKRREIFSRQIRLALEELGPTFIKLGQLISIRPDLFPPEYVFEMENLRDSVEAMPFDTIVPVLEQAFGASVEETFLDMDPVPIGSASIAQVYRAKLRSSYRPVVGDELQAGSELAIKVIRPGSEEFIRSDIELLKPFVARLSRFKRLARFNLEELIDEFAGSLSSECDLRVEAQVSDGFAHAFRDDPLVMTPRIVWPLTSKDVLTMEYVQGWSLDHAREAEAAGVDARMLALHGAEVFMQQVLVQGKFHADLHQSNLFLTPQGQICYLDFGIMGYIGAEQKDAIAQVLAATVYADAKRAITYSAELGLVVPVEQRDGVELQVSELMGRTFSKTPRDIKGFAIGFLGIMNDQKVSVPRGFGLLIKALVTVEGCAQMIYPDIDIVDAARVFATRLIAQHMMRPSRLYAKLPAAIDAAVAELVG